MPLEPGTSIGPYVVVALEGTGGMGQVYRARDARLKREVAIKVLPAEFSTDPDRLARFQREAEILATLHHSNIASVYGVEEFDGSRALVMEFVDGPTLAERLASGPFPATDVGDIARQLADALDAAHERGIVHRDLKPANIKVTRDGTVKVLDFGLAKALDRSGESGGSGRHGEAAGVYRPDRPDRPGLPDLSASPTLTSPAQMTGVGVILGTAAYMSPEQARGRPVDKRADIWAYGCVLFELLSGRRAFHGETVTDVLAAVVSKEPDWSGLPPDTPAELRTIIRRCLRKDPKSRARDMGDVRTILDDAAAGVDATVHPSSDASHRAPGRSWKPWALAISSMLLGALAVGALALVKQSSPPARATRFVVLPPDGGAFNATYLHQAISPDGSRLAFLAYAGSGPSMVWVRALDDVTPRSLPGTEGALTLFWSPDSTAIAFFADGFLKRIGVNGGAVRNIAGMPSSALQLFTSAGPSGSWSSKGTIVFGPADDGRLFQVDSKGGTPTAVSALSEPKGDRFHLLPEFLPDGQHFLYISRPGGDIWVGSVDGGQARHLLNADCKALYVAGQLLYGRGNTLYRQGFRPDSLDLQPEPSVVAEGVRCNPTNGGGGYSVSTNGVLSHRGGEVGTQEQLTWYTRSGEVQGTVEGRTGARDLRLSPNLRLLAVDELRVLGSARDSDIWLIDVLRGSRQRLTSDGARNQMPVWSPDGAAVVFSQQVGEQTRLVRVSATDAAKEDVLVEADCVQRPTDWSTDHRFLVYDRSCKGGSFDVWALTLDRSRKPFAVLASKFDERQARVSPDVHWIAYSSDESGKSQVFVQSFPTPGARTPVSIDGGTHPQWRRDGKELVFMDLQRRLVAVDIDLKSNPPTVGAPKVLFQTNAPRDLSPNANSYDMTPDGQRFLVANVVEGLQSPPIVVVLDWMSDLPPRR